MLLFSRLATGLAITTATRRTQFLCKRNFVVSTAFREKLTQEQKNQKTFSNQHRIPRLPIPTLQETADRYVQSLRPLLPDNEYEQATNAVNTFIEPGGFGGVLQRRLQELDSKDEHSWLEKIWLRKGYLEWREPSYINVNWWAQFKDSPEGSVASQPGKISEFQIRRAAGLISNMLNFNDLINREELPPDMQGKKQQPLCMNQYRNQFGTARIAEMPADRIQNQYPCTARHIMVIIKDQIFKVDVISAEGKRLPVRTIETQLEKAVKAVDSMFVTHSPPVGVLTSEHRDVWAKARASLSHEAENRSNLDIIDTAIFVVCLEHAPGGAGLDDFHPVLQHNTNGRNRWYDKSLQLIIANDGKAGFNGEHTPADAVIPGEIANFIVKNEPAKDPVGADAGATVPIPQSLKWVIPADVQRMIQEAEKKAAKLARDIDSKLLHYNRYGSEKLKQAKISPDAYIQMALQLVYYRLFSVPCPTYESASSRAFLHGRTETVRSCSVDSVRFTQAFDNSTVKKEEKVLLFQKAINSHLDYMKAASSGKGVDRHLLGLRCMIAGESELSRATLFTDSSYIKSMYFKLSSSNMSPGDYLWGGFAPVTPEGFGVNYAIGKDNIKFSVSTWKSTRDATSADFRDAIRVALDDLERVFVS